MRSVPGRAPRPTNDMADPLFDHLVGGDQQRSRNRETERLSRLQVDGELEFSRLHDRKVSRLFALENTADIEPGIAKNSRKAGTVTHQAPCPHGLH